VCTSNCSTSDRPLFACLSCILAIWSLIFLTASMRRSGDIQIWLFNGNAWNEERCVGINMQETQYKHFYICYGLDIRQACFFLIIL